MESFKLRTGQTDQSGATAIVCICTTTHIIVANAGDSRGIMMKDRLVNALSDDHKPYNEKEKERIEKAGGYVSDRRVNSDLAVSRALGDFGYKLSTALPAEKQQVTAFPDIKIVKIDGTEQFVLLACDGIWDVQTNAQAGDFMKKAIVEKYKEDPPEIVTEKILDHALDKGSRDNMTALVIINPQAIKFGEIPKPPEVIQAEQEKAELARAEQARAEQAQIDAEMNCSIETQRL